VGVGVGVRAMGDEMPIYARRHAYAQPLASM
jgi:hypothetical protein